MDREARVAPAHDLLHHSLWDEFLPEEKSENLAGEELGQKVVLEGSEMMKYPVLVLAALCNQEVEMGVEIEENCDRFAASRKRKFL